MVLIWGASLGFHLLRLGGRSGFHNGGPGIVRDRQALDIDLELQQPLFANLTLKDRHDVSLVTFDNLCVGVEDRFPHISLVRENRSPVFELDGMTEHIAEVWRTPMG